MSPGLRRHHSSKRGPAFVCLAVALAVLVCACGGSEESTPPLSKAEFVKQGNAICTAGNEEIERDFEAFAKEHGSSNGSPPSEAESEEAAETILIPGIQDQVDKVRALGPPDEAAEKVLDAVEEATEKAEEDPVALMEEKGGNPFAKANELAREYGLTACSE